uniref:Uncharacterized protein n=1 Tax=Rhizophora mucronata TaxID=61149 RepID=A0A2P2R086_RHIMU
MPSKEKGFIFRERRQTNAKLCSIKQNK